ncbi:PREDICTED: uncharacterized protein LOC109590354 isoform X2 [Amphimedon queenslandica]|uniref:Uncharacterized protein n=1 Tax=Amphimedon queenslandica TaxID=400682 RepID=A0AAN0JY35_AMPQE|nr:PREDICTED: uncharacterized protein LOC109590354 isoform X2 [Amphimedon queenslandica]|eukprot:XP_019861835.1 PREDICTED: uncharacterized protein LOC109590354 isoform X2 [Amphimedon queenslandica]
MTLRVYKKYYIDIINCYTRLEIRVRGHCRDICPQIRELVSKAVKESSKDLKLQEDNKLVFAFKCPLQKTCIVEEDKSSTWCTNCEVSCDVLRSDDSYRCWFSDHKLPSPGRIKYQEEVPQNNSRPAKHFNWKWALSFIFFFTVSIVLASVAQSMVERNTQSFSTTRVEASLESPPTTRPTVQPTGLLSKSLT